MVLGEGRVGGAGWSSPSGSPSPPPAPPPAPRRWPPPQLAASSDTCPRCRGRFASVNSQTTSLNNSYSHSYKDIGCPRGTAEVEEESGWAGAALCERELRALHRSVPALRRRDLDTLAIRQHFYPEGGWGWIICGAAFLVNLLSSGLQLAFGLLYIYALKHLGEAASLMVACMGGLSVGVSLATAPLVVAICRRKSTRLTAVLGGLLLALACLFTSFAVQLHQVMLSYGLVLGVGCGVVRETSSLMLGHYFRKRREFVEMVAQAGAGVGIALFSVFYKEAVGKLGWRLGLQAVTGLLILGFFLGLVYRSASLYHPQRRAILHLKNQRKKVKEKKTHIRVPKPPFFDFSPLKSRTVRMLLLASGTAAFGLYTPVFYLALQGYKEGLEDSALVLLQTFLGFATALGCVGFGLVIVRPSSQCLISRQYLAQAAMLGIGLSLLALSSVQGYHGYVLFVWLYGLCLGGFLYSVKMLTMERVRARHFTRAWGFVQGAKAIPVILGVPVTGYINQQSPRAGYYFSFATTIIGAILLFFVGFSKRPEPSNSINSNMTAATLTNGDCICPGMSPQVQRFNNNFNHCGNVNYGHYPPPLQAPIYSHEFFNHHHPHHPHSYNHLQNGLPKSLSFAAPLDYHEGNYINCLNAEHSCAGYNCVRSPYRYRHNYNRGLRPSKSVPEGLARYEPGWSRGGSCRSSCRRPIIRNVQVIEQITTSV